MWNNNESRGLKSSKFWKRLRQLNCITIGPRNGKSGHHHNSFHNDTYSKHKSKHDRNKVASEARARKPSSASVYSMSSHKTSEGSVYGSNGYKKTASLNEIHQLYSALQDLVNPSPKSPRRDRAYTTSASSSDILGLERQYQVSHDRRMCHRSSVSRTKSVMSSKSSMAKLSSEKVGSLQDISDRQAEGKGAYIKMVSRMGLKSNSSNGKPGKLDRKDPNGIDGLTTTFGRRETRRSSYDMDLTSDISGESQQMTVSVNEYKNCDIDDLLEMAKQSPDNGGRNQSNTLPDNLSHSSLDPEKISSRLQKWYQLATENAMILPEVEGRARSQPLQHDLGEQETYSSGDIDFAMGVTVSGRKSIDIDETELNDSLLPLSAKEVRRSLDEADIAEFEKMINNLTNYDSADVIDVNTSVEKCDIPTFKEAISKQETSRRSNRMKEGSVRGSGKETSSKSMSTETLSSKDDVKTTKTFRSDAGLDRNNCSNPEAEDNNENRYGCKLSRDISKKKVEYWLKYTDNDLVIVTTKNDCDKKDYNATVNEVDLKSNQTRKENEFNSYTNTDTEKKNNVEEVCSRNQKDPLGLIESQAELNQNVSILKVNENEFNSYTNTNTEKKNNIEEVCSGNQKDPLNLVESEAELNQNASILKVNENEFNSYNDTNTEKKNNVEEVFLSGNKKEPLDLVENEAQLDQNASIIKVNERLPWQQPSFYNPEPLKKDDRSYLTVIVQY